MKIISKFTDYYDYLVNIYGVDDNLVLNRLNKEIDNIKKEEYCNALNHEYHPLRWLMRCCNLEYFSRAVFNKQNQVFRYPSLLLFCGKVYLIEKTPSKDTLTLLIDDEPINEKVPFYGNKVFIDKETKEVSAELHKYLSSQPLTKEHIDKILSKIDRPMAFIEEVTQDTIILNPEFPNLSKIENWSSCFSPDETFKTITTYLQEMRRDVDKEPPVKLDNKEKIIKAGFDTRISFRGKQK